MNTLGKLSEGIAMTVAACTGMYLAYTVISASEQWASRRHGPQAVMQKDTIRSAVSSYMTHSELTRSALEHKLELLTSDITRICTAHKYDPECPSLYAMQAATQKHLRSMK